MITPHRVRAPWESTLLQRRSQGANASQSCPGPFGFSLSHVEITVRPPGRLGLDQAPFVVWQKIAELLSAKDRSAFQKTCKWGRDAGAFVEVCLLKKVQPGRAVYFERLFSPISSDPQDTARFYRQLQGAKETARKCAALFARPEVLYVGMNAAISDQIGSETLRACAKAAYVWEEQDWKLIQFCRKKYPDLVPPGEEWAIPEAAAHLRNVLQNPAREIAWSDLNDIDRETPPEFFPKKMSYEFLRAVFARLLQVGNENALLGIVEKGSLAGVEEINPRCFQDLQILEVWKIAVRRVRVRAIRALAPLWDRNLSAWGAGVLLRDEYLSTGTYLEALETIRSFSRAERCLFYSSRWRIYLIFMILISVFEGFRVAWRNFSNAP